MFFFIIMIFTMSFLKDIRREKKTLARVYTLLGKKEAETETTAKA